jgi:MEMO1 family protein
MLSKRFCCLGTLILGLLAAFNECHSQPNGKVIPLRGERIAAFAGQFYPATKKELTDTLNAMFRRAVAKQSTKPVLAVIVPHAGYVFSGTVAASSYNQAAVRAYKNVFVIGSSHRVLFDGAAIDLSGNIVTPLGTITADLPLSRKLIAENSCFNDYNEAFNGEHTVEVQLPFLQHILGNNLNLVSIVIGTQNTKTCQAIAKALKPYFNINNLFVFSTDLSHYPRYTDAKTSDKIITQAVLLNSPDKFLKTIEEINNMKIPNLQTTMCGWTSILTLLNITGNMTGIRFEIVDSKNSGDSSYGNKSEVVGYAAIAVEQDKTVEKVVSYDFLTPTDKQALLRIARQTITNYVSGRRSPEIDKKSITQGMNKPSGAFVTLMEEGQLRGCIGSFSEGKPLYQVVGEMAISAAVNDSRFERVAKDELDKLDIEISVLTPMKKISSIDEIELGRDGVYIKSGFMGGTFLPQVAAETGWSKEDFMGHLSRDKAGLGWEGWKKADIYTYQAIVFGEKARISDQ